MATQTRLTAGRSGSSGSSASASRLPRSTPPVRRGCRFSAGRNARRGFGPRHSAFSFIRALGCGTPIGAHSRCASASGCPCCRALTRATTARSDLASQHVRSVPCALGVSIRAGALSDLPRPMDIPVAPLAASRVQAAPWERNSAMGSSRALSTCAPCSGPNEDADCGNIRSRLAPLRTVSSKSGAARSSFVFDPNASSGCCLRRRAPSWLGVRDRRGHRTCDICWLARY